MSLKDAMLKAGLKSTKSENERVYKPKKEVKIIEVHQSTRNFCEVCQLIQPDVERFAHKNPTIDAEWICTRCADRAEIHDQFRRTNQSDSAKKKTYRREFGPTQVFQTDAKKADFKNKIHEKKPAPKPIRNDDSDEDDEDEINFNR